MFAAAFRSVLAVVVLFLDATYLPVRPSGPQEGVIDLAAASPGGKLASRMPGGFVADDGGGGGGGGGGRGGGGGWGEGGGTKRRP